MTRPTPGPRQQGTRAAQSPQAQQLSAALAGAVDLGALQQQKQAQAAAEQRARQQAAAVERGEAPALPTVIDVTEATFQTEVIERSQTVPVVLDFWADWCGPCKQLSPILEKIAEEMAGQFVLAKIDTEANAQLSQMARIQSIPAIKAVLGGQIVAEFNGALPEPQVRQWITSLVDAASQALAQQGGAPGGRPGGPAVDERVEQAEEAMATGDMDKAESLLTELATEQPGDPMARAGLAQVGLLRRTADVQDPQQAVDAAAAHPDDVEKQGLAADLELLSGRQQEAFARLVALVARTGGDERDAARAHLIGLFDLFPPDDPDVAAARRSLTSALF